MIPAGLELRDIRTFLIVAEELHFARSAERLGVTPSRVSQRIAHLEARLGGPLFMRTSRRVQLTPAGEQLRVAASRAYEQLSRALSDACTTLTGVAGLLRIGSFARSNDGPHFVRIVRAFEARHPVCHVQVIDTGFERDQRDWLRRGEIDLLVMRLPLHDADIEVGPILSCEPRVVAVSVDHPLAQRDSVSVEDLADWTLVDVPTLPREMFDAYVPPRTPSGKAMQRTVSRSVAETSLRVAVREIVHPTVPSFLEHYPHEGVTAVPIRDLPPSQTALMWLKDRHDPRRQAFVEVASEILSGAERVAQAEPVRGRRARSRTRRE